MPKAEASKLIKSWEENPFEKVKLMSPISFNKLKEVTGNFKVAYPCSVPELEHVGNNLIIKLRNFIMSELKKLGGYYIVNQELKNELPAATQINLNLMDRMKQYELFKTSENDPSKGIKR